MGLTPIADPAPPLRFLGVDFAAMDTFAALRSVLAAREGAGFTYVVTPNVDHVVLLHEEGTEPWREAFRASVPTGGEVVYLDNGTGAQLGFLELLPVTPGMDETFTRFWEASRGWDGTDPVRSFI